MWIKVKILNPQVFLCLICSPDESTVPVSEPQEFEDIVPAQQAHSSAEKRATKRFGPDSDIYTLSGTNPWSEKLGGIRLEVLCCFQA